MKLVDIFYIIALWKSPKQNLLYLLCDFLEFLSVAIHSKQHFICIFVIFEEISQFIFNVLRLWCFLLWVLKLGLLLFCILCNFRLIEWWFWHSFLRWSKFQKVFLPFFTEHFQCAGSRCQSEHLFTFGVFALLIRIQ